jgi:hypothetical protein
MRRLSHADLELRVPGIEPEAGDWPDAAQLSAAVSAAIARLHDGDRTIAQRAASARVAAALGVKDLIRWRPVQRAAFESMSLLLRLIPDLAAWPAKDRRDCVAVIRAKGAPDESDYARRSAAHRRLRRALQSIAAG